MSKVAYETSAKEEWSERNSSLKPQLVRTVPFSDVFEKYLPKSSKFTCIEIGAIPGNFLVYLHKQFGYIPTGIDFAEQEHLFHETMKVNGIKDYHFIKGDFFKHKFPTQYNVVASFGFIEHFDDVKDVLQRHADLVKPGGYLVITLPNFRFLQHLYHHYFDKPNLSIHNLRAMHIGFLKSTLRGLGLQKIYTNYYGNLSVWRQESELNFRRLRQVNRIHRFVSKYGKMFPTSRLYAPYIILIYHKQGSAMKKEQL